MSLRALVLAAAFLTVPAPAHAAAPGWTLPALTVADGVVKDVTGRTVLLRGANVNQLNDYAQNDPSVPAVAPLTRDDFARMAALGFNVVRLNIAWSALEPAPGAFDRAYVARIRQAVADAKAYGMYTVLDMHQDAWGKAVGTPPGTSCPPLTRPGIGWDGAPAWATLTDGWTTCNVGGIREISPAVARAFQNFYDDRDGIQGHLVTVWAKLAAEFRGEPAVAGYDLLNEPNPGLREPFGAAAQIGRFYQRTITAIRAAERGRPKLAIFEPSAVWSALGLDALPPREHLADPLTVFSPHLYAESITVGGKTPSIEGGFALAKASAAYYGRPLWTGEWGWFGDPATDRPQVERFMDALDAAGIGGAWWSWTQACGDPHAVRDGGTRRPQGNLNRIDCPSGLPLGLVAGFAEPLSRAYPRAAPGVLTRTSPGTIQGRNPSGDCRLEAWYPAEPTLTTKNIRNLRLERIPGGWRLTACAEGDYSLTAT